MKATYEKPRIEILQLHPQRVLAMSFNDETDRGHTDFYNTDADSDAM